MSVSVFATPFTLDANDTYILKTGQSDNTRRGSRRIIKLTKVSGYDGSIVVSSRARGSSGAFTSQPYEKMWLNGAAGDGSKVTTAITGDSTIAIDDTGLEIALVSSGRTTGSMTVENAVSADQ